MCSDTVISVSGVSKTYRAYDHPLHALLARASSGRIGRHKEFHALHDVSLEIQKGDSVGIVGRNGSGKSTLLQLICGVCKPTSGKIDVSGRVSALLELGSGFHPEFTGRENVFLQGAIIGLTREEMEARLDDIAAFADIGEYMTQPAKTYSSGMFVRLAFAVAVSIDPEILIVDEALAVGDALFQKRCHAKIMRLRESGLTLLLVSHDHELVRNLTEKALLLDHGRVVAWGKTKEVTRSYRKLLFEEEAHYWGGADADAMQRAQLRQGKPESSFGMGGATIKRVRIFAADRRPRMVFLAGEQIVIEISAQIETPLTHLNVAVVIRTLTGTKIYSWGTFNQDIAVWAGVEERDVFWDKEFNIGDETVVTLCLDGNLGAESYEVQAVISRELGKQYGSQQILHWQDEAGFFRVEMNSAVHVFGGVCDMRGKAVFND
ncbi:MAG: ABC transporter ATP-binding protein [Candidatus Accumulibacter phosphatis]|uniref:ABC transporter ATP-binding protein n=1 Tax=Candidatus Accumulibacter sp. ACC012 TaxID=2823332 RepID=UPI0025BA0341|nr:ABC transporter ATP-binding protein [Candidatus Accumulibacter sp. ACC012]